MNSCILIAEVAQAHDGSLGQAHAFIDAAADAGANVIKFQTHIAAAESRPDEPWRIKFSPQDERRFDYWKRMEFTEAQWSGLKKHADERNIAFISSPFSIEAVELLKRVGVAFWKVASGEINNQPLLQAIAETGQQVLVSSGMSPINEIRSTVRYLLDQGCSVGVMQCTSRYPCPPEQVGLGVLAELRQQLGVPVGLSDHSGTIYAGLAAVALGAAFVEVHVTFHRKCFGPDTSSSITFEQLEDLVRGVRFIETSMNARYDKDREAKSLEPMRQIFMKSVCAARALEAGTVLQRGDLTTKKPGTGIPAWDLDRCIGGSLKRSYRAFEMLDVDEVRRQRA